MSAWPFFFDEPEPEPPPPPAPSTEPKRGRRGVIRRIKASVPRNEPKRSRQWWHDKLDEIWEMEF